MKYLCDVLIFFFHFIFCFTEVYLISRENIIYIKDGIVHDLSLYICIYIHEYMIINIYDIWYIIIYISTISISIFHWCNVFLTNNWQQMYNLVRAYNSLLHGISVLAINIEFVTLTIWWMVNVILLDVMTFENKCLLLQLIHFWVIRKYLYSDDYCEYFGRKNSRNSQRQKWCSQTIICVVT